ncbi:hypothetical protein HBI56_160070 [Parastagonospora nodorum]|uniref:Uncharacterized protein n=1 Tax=Phaeosphaeria nodorum (strain SN15 / ATCC MYA-4574 / FGSC 10173) TaxID=321614 RepID=A0A7U2ESW1_PHANO|nr:hypothetical protein HBH56_190800 [Parastagonospora nodorum]QRC92441.1 hypothetical protein JI435_402480 [Parastagonospora nodorum SN15]KAH3925101.1 hypothetical protein HBH54_186610 [Parastagonospora nodorum]KAH3954102.1 hypothetical protein HBH53_025960 [Parastagonospora nodorum]KAH3963707.1 hypothetical protein HBH51_165770 [Parastagonospora nodorum]
MQYYNLFIFLQRLLVLTSTQLSEQGGIWAARTSINSSAVMKQCTQQEFRLEWDSDCAHIMAL